MRLLQVNSQGIFSLTEYAGHTIPSYAILSHTWGADSEEVTFEDLRNDTQRTKAGYNKLRFCGKQAAINGLQYFWIDTCCIDKSNPIEFQHAINSMFRWYQNAARCYVYLSDIKNTDNDEVSQIPWQSSFGACRWFTRGWTLQELLAPNSVEFFSQNHIRLGDKNSLEQEINEITGIPVKALQGSDLSHFTVDERMSWVQNRETKYEEDKIYSMQGIFDVNIPLLYGEGWEKALIRLQREIQESSKPTALLSKVDIHWIVPFDRNPHFTGREIQLAKVEERLFLGGQTTRCAITGLGGIGKTQLVLELVYRIRDTHKDCSVIWIPATNMESLHQAYLETAQKFGIPGWEDNKADVKKLVQDYLSKNSAGQWLLVFDNADDINMWTAKSGSETGSSRLIEYLPRSEKGCIVFTSRDRKTAVKLAQQNIVEVPEFNEDTATQLLHKCLINPGPVHNGLDTKALLEELTYLPLAIVQAAAYINENGITFTEYRCLLAEQEEDVIDLLSEEFEDNGRYHNIKNPVATTWLISFEQIRHRDPLAAEYLSFMACINPKGIPRSLLPAATSQKKEIEALGILEAYSFIIKRPADLALDLHRLVHLATRSWLRKEELITLWTERAITRLAEMFPVDGLQSRSVWRTYLPHAQYVLLSDVVDKDITNRTELVVKFAMCLYQEGRYDEAESQLIGVLGQEHPYTLLYRGNLAVIYQAQGRWKEAEEIETQVIETRSRVLGQEHPDTLTSRSNLASTYRAQGRWKEAEEIELQVIETRSRVLGQEHPGTLNSISNLAAIYYRQGRLKEAEELEMQVIKINQRVLGHEHPDTLASRGNLASTYRAQGRLKEAEELEMEVMEIRQRVLGQEHPNTLTSRGNLASIYQEQGRWKEAEELEMEVMAIRQRVLGQEHPNTLNSKSKLALTYQRQGRLTEAEELIAQVIEIQKRVLGEEHPETLNSMTLLALTYEGQKRWKQSEELGLKLVEIRKRVLGAEHPDTLICMSNLGVLYWTQGRWKEAEDLEVQVLEARKKVLGPEHPDTLTATSDLAVMFKGQGKSKQALDLMEECFETRARILGANHPEAQSTLEILEAWRREISDQATT